MKVIRNVSVLSIAALLSSFAANTSFAAYYHGPHHEPVHHGGGYGNGFDDGMSAALGGIFLSMASSDTNAYDADTLVQSAAIYEADGTSTPVFESFVGTMSEQLTAKMGAEKMSQVDEETLRQMVAEQILNNAQ